MQMMAKKLTVLLLVAVAIQWLATPVMVGRGMTLQSMNAPNTYYVSSSQGDDSYNGLSINTPFATLSKVNSLLLQPGEHVLFSVAMCGGQTR
jgi:hypothetical protein